MSKCISVIVPIYNTEDTLEKCIESIIFQTYKDLHIVLIDDGSTDIGGTICDIYAEYDSRIKVFHSTNKGLSAARNLGIEKALENKSDFISFVDSDDYLDSHMYEKLLSVAEKNNADVVQCATYTEGFRVNKISKTFNAIYNTRQEIFEAFLEGKIGNVVWDKLYKSHLFKEIRFPENRNYEDRVFTYRILLNCKKIICIPYVGYRHIMRKGSITHVQSMKNLADNWLSSKELYENLLEEIPELIDASLLINLSKFPANSISRMWRWAFGNDKQELKQYKNIIDDMHQFEKEKLRNIDKRNWPVKIKVPLLLSRSNTAMSLALGYFANQIFIYVFPHKAGMRQ